MQQDPIELKIKKIAFEMDQLKEEFSSLHERYAALDGQLKKLKEEKHKQELLARKYILYMHICPTGEAYIGTTYRKPNARWGLHGEGYKGLWFWYGGIQKYGWENIKHKILASEVPGDQAYQMEHALILKYGSWCPGMGFNNDLGGYRKHAKILPIACLDIGAAFPTAKQCANYLGMSPYYLQNHATDFYSCPVEYKGHFFQMIDSAHFNPSWKLIVFENGNWISFAASDIRAKILQIASE